MSSVFSAVTNLSRPKVAIGAAIVLAVIIGGLFFFYDSPTYQFVTVERGSINETVSFTGNTTPVRDVSLGFQITGTIARVYRNLGEKVYAGGVIAELNTATLVAALQQAQGAYNAAVASRSSSSLPEAALQARNAYLSAYTTLDTTLQNDVDTFFGDPTAYGPQLLIDAPMYDYGELSKERSVLTDKMDAYQQALSSADTSDPLTLLTSATTVAQDVSQFLSKLAVAANDMNSKATSAQLTALATARSTVNTLLATLSSARDAYRTGSAGATSLADASIEQAQASVAAALANLQNTKLVAPISGVLTKQDAKVGQLATLGTPLVAIIGDAGFEVDGDLSETDVGKVSVGDAAAMTLDAFPGETFVGSVFYIAPAETNTQGVISYQVKISFNKPDTRLKSGLTANVDIQTNHTDNILILPQYAILQNDEGTFVKVLEGSVAKEIPVVLGIQDQNGNVEVISGVAEGEQVLNIGLKAQ